MTSRDEYVAVIKEAFVTLGKKAAMEFLVAQLPFLGKGFGLAVLNPIVAYFVTVGLKGITEGVETAAFFLYIDMRVGAQGKDFERAAFENYAAQRRGTPEEKANAEARLRRELRKFVTLTN